MKQQIEAVIFDWAGTTVDFGCMAPVHALMAAFQAHGITVTLDEIRQPMGMLKIDHIKSVLDLDRINSEFNLVHGRAYQTMDVELINTDFEKRIFAILHEHTQVIPGTLEVQSYLRRMNIKIGSTTGYTQNMIQIVAKSAADQGYQPDVIMTAEQVKKGRPYPYMIQQNMAQLAIKNIAALIKVGDTLVDIEEGKNAGCWSVGIIEGSSMLGLTQEEMQQCNPNELRQKTKLIRYQMLNAGADFVLNTIDELPWVIDLINEKRN